jgi:hypothetical protein
MIRPAKTRLEAKQPTRIVNGRTVELLRFIPHPKHQVPPSPDGVATRSKPPVATHDSGVRL